MSNISKIQEQLVTAHADRKLCAKCGHYTHPAKFKMCWECFSTQKERVTDFNKCEHNRVVNNYEGVYYCLDCNEEVSARELKGGYESWKDYEESEVVNNE